MRGLDECPSEPIVTFHRSINAWSLAGYNVIVDGSLPYGDPPLRARCLAELSGGRTVIVGVQCSPDVVRRREVARPEHRPAGWAEQQAGDVNVGLDLLLTVDTSTGSPDEPATAVLRALDITR